MYHTDIIKLQDRQQGLPMVIALRDGVKVIDGLPGNVVLFDQNNEMGHAFRNSNTPYVSDSTKYEMVSFKYSEISNIRTNLSEEEMADVLSGLADDAVIDQADIQSILDSVVIKK